MKFIIKGQSNLNFNNGFFSVDICPEIYCKPRCGDYCFDKYWCGAVIIK